MTAPPISPHRILLLPGDGIGPEALTQAVRVLDALIAHGLDAAYDYGLIGGASLDETGEPLKKETIVAAQQADAVLMGAVGGPAWDGVPPELRPEQGLLQLRKALGCFANLRPIFTSAHLAEASTLKSEVVAGLDMLIVRELIGGIYFGEPRGIGANAAGEREAVNTYRYSEKEIARVAHIAFKAAETRRGAVCSVDKANVLEATRLWREVVSEVARDYPDVALTHMYVDNAAMQLVANPKQFDVILTGNLFGDILSDCAAMLTGSIGMLPSAALNATGRGLYEPVHGSAPDIAGTHKANPLATILSLAMLLRHSLNASDWADAVEGAVEDALAAGLRTVDIAGNGEDIKTVSTSDMGEAVVAALHARLNAAPIKDATNA